MRGRRGVGGVFTYVASGRQQRSRLRSATRNFAARGGAASSKVSCSICGIWKFEATSEKPRAGSLSGPKSSIQIPPKERRRCGMFVAIS